MAEATPDVMTGAPLKVAMTGRAQACDLMTKHAAKQVDRLLSHGGVDV